MIGVRKWFPEPARTLADLFRRRRSRIYALDGVSLEVGENEVLGVVGESGSGKTTLGKTIARLYEPDEGRIEFLGQDITHLDEKSLLPFRKHIQIIFQNPYSSLNPRRRVREIIGDAIRLHYPDREVDIAKELANVGLPPEYGGRYPHQLSGGERQRVAIARALSLNPKLVIADEITSSLDVSTQMQILKLLKDIMSSSRSSFIFISHDLAVVCYVSDRIAVMYSGKIVEEGRVRDVVSKPRHPYTQALIESVPDPYGEWLPRWDFQEKEAVSTTGCRYSYRCPHAMDKCFLKEPRLIEYGGGRVACYLYGE
jgi:oligopeptide/dipeptide ABC transporter ATP-binding protein